MRRKMVKKRTFKFVIFPMLWSVLYRKAGFSSLFSYLIDKKEYRNGKII